MDPLRGSKRSSISFGSYQRQPTQSSYLSTPYEGSLLSHGGVSGGNPYYVSRSPMYSPLDHSQPVFWPNGYSQLHQFRNTAALTGSSVCEYEANYPLFGVDWSLDDYVCLGSYRESGGNRLQVIKSMDMLNWDRVAECNVTFPVSTIQWQPGRSQTRSFATCSDSLRIWSLLDDETAIQEQINLSLCKHNKQQKKSVVPPVDKTGTGAGGVLGELPPITSFHWNPTDPNLLISSSIDTTCIVWDLQSSNYVRTQLIAHDSEVFDVRFLTQSTQLFASCGGDGSVRVFDLRCLAHSTIIYEPSVVPGGPDPTSGNPAVADHSSGADQGSSALLRLEPSPFDPNVVATFALDSTSILILDMRNPGSPVLTLDAHTASVNQIKWHPTRRNVLLSCGDDCQVLYWDLDTSLPSPTDPATASTTAGDRSADPTHQQEHKWSFKNHVQSVSTPALFYSNNGQEVNNIVWRPQGAEWFGAISAKRFQNVRI